LDGCRGGFAGDLSEGSFINLVAAFQFSLGAIAFPVSAGAIAFPVSAKDF
jgi:hypothetical protein